MSLDSIFKAYDVRGVVPDDWGPDEARRIGWAFARFAGSDRVLVGRDMRESGDQLQKMFMAGVSQAGAAAIDVGLCSTDLIYYASGAQGLPGAMFTASHNPARYNGIKFCLSGAAPVSQDTGLADIRSLAGQAPPPGDLSFSLRSQDLLEDFATHLLSCVDLAGMPRLTVAVDAANGMGGLVVPAVLGRLPIDIVPLYFELDGTFPNHPADPIQPENLVDLQKAVVDTGADLGLAFDGDADRVFLLDERAEPVSGSLTTALIASRVLTANPGATVIYNVICSRTVREVIEEHGGTGLRSRVGHSFIKEHMASSGAVFGGEHSGHYYFKDNYRADSGLLAALYVLGAMAASGRRLSELLAPLQRYAASGEINTEVADQSAAVERVSAAFGDGEQDRLDGLTVDYPDWWCNVRASNTEPLLRLNVEARTEEMMSSKRDQIISLIKE